MIEELRFKLEKGDKLRAYHQIKELSKHFDVHLISTSELDVAPDHLKELKPFCKSINIFTISVLQKVWGTATKLFSRKPIQVGYFHHYSIQLKINKLLSEIKPDHIYCQLIRVTEYVRKSKIKKTLDYMDALARGMERRIEDAPFYMKWFLKTETIRLKRYEHFIFEDFDHHVIISEQDRKLIVNVNNDDVIVVPNGVDYTTYKQHYQYLEDKPYSL